MSKQTEPFLADALFQPVKLGPLELKNRIVMAPMTRNRADQGNVPAEMTIEYYAQRASVGLIIAEATQVSDTAQGYASTPGLHTPQQIAEWKKVTDEVHRRGGKIFVQLWHTGRMSHTAFQPHGQAPVAPSAIAAQAKTYIPGVGYADTSVPRALETDEIAGVVDDFRTAAANAIKAGFDGVEIHGAHGYLIDAFLRDGSNKRVDRYGGSIENRARFLLEVMQAVVGEIGAERTGIRISPVSPVNDSSESAPQPLFEYVVRELEKLHPVFIHVVEGHTGGPRDNAPFDYEALRRLYSGVWMVNNGYTKEMAIDAITSGRADLVSFGRPLISNPDLVRRFRENAPLNPLFEDAPLYGGVGPHGYIDYPALPD
ncbi:alkene reductase [Noviherbaspirillum sp. UKPF54]|uniref:alkene reductase n=1 Tax=Noviherbaspirillum sp. UKPF54 TaxID=2601898 RepID=UPI0011B15061|nr:alkene reductase [Noviherbaspirillum sp. UKPF54]QDZ29386.1 alkene reductase [Noviherbaspirillum sp. UKPF54]